MSSPSALSSGAVALRRVLVKRPWIYWLVVAIAAIGAGASTLARADRVDAERAAWGVTRTVWVTGVDHLPGDPLTAHRVELPEALVPDGAVDATDTIDDLAARQFVAAGRVVHTTDVVAGVGPQSLTPIGWLAVPVNESPVSGAALGDRVRVVGDGVVLSAEAVVVGHHDGSSLVAVPSAEAPAIAALAAQQGVTLLLIP